MFKSFLMIGALFLLGNSSSSQNLILNGDFEFYSNCPNNTGLINLAVPWGTANNNVPPTYFHTCSTYPIVDVPVNLDSLLGYQQPHSGNAYIGYNFYAPLGPGFRQYLTAPLLDTLAQNKTYKLAYFVNLSNFSKYGVDGMGAYFSAQQPNCPTFNCILNVTPQVSNPSGNILLDTANWMQISGSFKAEGGERFITIGNFMDDSTTQKAISRPGYNWSTFFYIDDVSLIEDTSLNVSEIEIEKQILVYPNPAVAFVNIEVKGNNKLNKIEIFNSVGGIVFSMELNESNNKVNIEEFPVGLYFIMCGMSSGNVIRKKFNIVH